jgi:hypothetical protein
MLERLDLAAMCSLLVKLRLRYKSYYNSVKQALATASQAAPTTFPTTPSSRRTKSRGEPPSATKSKDSTRPSRLSLGGAGSGVFGFGANDNDAMQDGETALTDADTFEEAKERGPSSTAWTKDWLMHEMPVAQKNVIPSTHIMNISDFEAYHCEAPFGRPHPVVSRGRYFITRGRIRRRCVDLRGWRLLVNCYYFMIKY